MPPRTNNNPGNKKKKKGKAPAHQNTYAFVHNPGSKLTAKILSSPNVGVCKKCYDKIEWRKKYRKYKPLTQPATCNKCNKRNIKAAYHTICSACSWIPVDRDCVTASSSNTSSSDDTSTDDVDGDARIITTKRIKMCEVCVKAPVTSRTPDEMEEERKQMEEKLTREISSGGKKLSLREKKSLERQLQKLELGDTKKKKNKKDDKEENGDVELGSQYSDNEEEVNEESDIVLDKEEEADPFLEAVGGKEKLLTGEAYQKMILERETSSEPQTV